MNQFQSWILKGYLCDFLHFIIVRYNLTIFQSSSVNAQLPRLTQYRSQIRHLFLANLTLSDSFSSSNSSIFPLKMLETIFSYNQSFGACCRRFCAFTVRVYLSGWCFKNSTDITLCTKIPPKRTIEREREKEKRSTLASRIWLRKHNLLFEEDIWIPVFA